MLKNGVLSRDMDGGSMGTVARAANVLRCVAEASDDICIKEIAERLSLAPSTVHRLLHLLIDQGLIERNPNAPTYRAGAELFRLGALVVNKTQLPKVALPYMRQLVEACDEFCMLNMYLPSEGCMMVVETLKASQQFDLAPPRYRRWSMLKGATGYAILAFLPEEDVRQIYDAAASVPRRDQQLPDFQVLMRVLETVRKKGYAHSVGHRAPGIAAFSSPIFGACGSVMGSFTVSLPEARYRPEREEILGKVAATFAGRISNALGYRAAHPTRISAK